jgi:hypothetical protein
MGENIFDTTLADVQGTVVDPVSPDRFDIAGYADYAAELDEICRRFWTGTRGVLVHRRFRVAEVFASACRDMDLSLSLQLGALKMSMSYRMDVPNFLEPWYGIGTVTSAFGADYIWKAGLAPVAEAPFNTVEEALAFDPVPIEKTCAGRHTLEMIEYFLSRTKGRLPISFSDVQSPLNAASALVDTSEFFMAVLDRPERVRELLSRVTDLSADFLRKQADLIGECRVRPGHGFASSRGFEGIGTSDDSSTMLSPGMYSEICASAMERLGSSFGGIAFHSCGDWSGKIDAVRKMRGLLMVDGAFTPATDPDPNPPEVFRREFADSGKTINARMVGDRDSVLDAAEKLYGEDMKMIGVTYCRTPEEQERVYRDLHEL